MRSYNIEGIIIKRLNVGEADKLITIFSRDEGKVTLVAKGVRKLTSKRAGSLELFNHIRASVATGRGSLDILKEVQLQRSFTEWRKYMGRVNVAYQLAETIDKLTPDHQPHQVIFETLLTALSGIDKLGDDWAKVTEGWLMDIVRELGFWSEDEEFKGDVYELIERLSERSMNSPKLLKKLQEKVL